MNFDIIRNSKKSLLELPDRSTCLFTITRLLILNLVIFFIGCSENSIDSAKITNSESKDSSTRDTKEYTPYVRMPLPSPSEIGKLSPDGGKEFNRLIFESSPYLLQHARNPINWYPWGEDAFNIARIENKPVFLSIGYTTCHWCHVMEHESFEDQEVADLMNRDYICIKVDREERPDIDNIYMTVTQMMTGRGGWPMTVIMSPQKIPFFAGTYFPKSSMIQLIPHFAKVWKEQPDEVKEVGDSIMKSLVELQHNHPGKDLNASNLDNCFFALKKNFDPDYGGFGDSPKFPTAHTLSFLLRYYKRTQNKEALSMVQTTLRKIRQGGIYDQIGFGIHRYSVDHEWLVPHFEKMLYDQALFAIANLECFQVTKDPFFERTVNEILDYVMREMTSAKGGFFSAEDADSEGEEGKFYVWSAEEVKKILSPKDASFFMKIFGFEKSGNFLDEATKEKTGANIPHLDKSLDEYAIDYSEDPETFRKKIKKLQSKLFSSRNERIKPQKDDKVLTDWNGLMISAFAQSAKALNRKIYLDAAKKAADFCLSELRLKNGRLHKRWRKGKVGLPAHLEDYAFLSQGLLDLYEASFEVKYLKTAIELTDHTIKHFEDSKHGGFFLTSDDGEELLIRAKEFYDGAIPSGNSVMALNLLRIHKITGNEKYLDSAENLFAAYSNFLEKNPRGAEVLLNALDFALAPAKEIVIAGKIGTYETDQLISLINNLFLPAKVVIHRPINIDKPEIFSISPFVKNQGLVNGKPAVYICENQTCQKPETEINLLKKLLSD